MGWDSPRYTSEDSAVVDRRYRGRRPALIERGYRGKRPALDERGYNGNNARFIEPRLHRRCRNVSEGGEGDRLSVGGGG